MMCRRQAHRKPITLRPTLRDCQAPLIVPLARHRAADLGATCLPNRSARRAGGGGMRAP